MNKLPKKGIGFLMIIIMATLMAMFGVSLAAGQALKESKVSKAPPQCPEARSSSPTDGPEAWAASTPSPSTGRQLYRASP